MFPAGFPIVSPKKSFVSPRRRILPCGWIATALATRLPGCSRNLAAAGGVAMSEWSPPEPRNSSVSTIRRFLGDCLIVLGDVLLLAGGLAVSTLSTLLAVYILNAIDGRAASEWNSGMWIGLVGCALVAPSVLVFLSRRAGRPILALAAILGAALSLVGILYFYALAHLTLGF